MKFVFYIGGKKKKQQIIKAKTNDDFILVAKIAKCELTKNSILKDLDFSAGKLMCLVKDKELNMKELWAYLEPKLKSSETNNKSNSKKKKNKDLDKKESKKKDKSFIVGKKTKKKNKKKDKKKSSKKKKETKSKIQTNQGIKKSNGLVHITRR